jgi:hypothetical protein
VLNELSKQILLGKVQPKSKVLLDVFDGQCLSCTKVRDVVSGAEGGGGGGDFGKLSFSCIDLGRSGAGVSDRFFIGKNVAL